MHFASKSHCPTLLSEVLMIEFTNVEEPWHVLASSGAGGKLVPYASQHMHRRSCPCLVQKFGLPLLRMPSITLIQGCHCR